MSRTLHYSTQPPRRVPRHTVDPQAPLDRMILLLYCEEYDESEVWTSLLLSRPHPLSMGMPQQEYDSLRATATALLELLP